MTRSRLPARDPRPRPLALLALLAAALGGCSSRATRPRTPPDLPAAEVVLPPEAAGAEGGTSRATVSRSKVIPYPIHRHELPNGLQAVVVPTDHPGIVSYWVVVRVGSRNELEPGHSGFAHFFEHMMFRGTERHPAREYNEILKRVGADNNAFTTADFTAYYTTAAAASLDTISGLESDRFQNLRYALPEFQKEARAVLGEYNKNASDPFLIMYEKLQDTAFTTHTYKHTTMGFLKDIEDMPNQFEYSIAFFGRYYRPEYTTVLVVGDVKPDRVFDRTERDWGGWKRGSYVPAIPAEPPQTEPREVAVTWPNPTLPYLVLAWKMPGFDPASRATPALDLLGELVFGPTSPLYQELVLEKQLVDTLEGGPDVHRDPFLFTVIARVKAKDEASRLAVRARIEAALAAARDAIADPKRLQDTKSALRYRLAMRLDTASGIASTLTRFLALTGDVTSLDTLFEAYERVTADDLREAARRVFVPAGLTTLTLTEEVKP